jgi:ferredoxin
MGEDLRERRLSGLTVRIDRSTCIGSGSCTRIAPEVFELDSSLVVTFTSGVAEVPRERLLEACGVCPVDALSASPAE